MHIIRNCILSFAMVSVFAVYNAESQEPVSLQKVDAKPVKPALGIQAGVRFHQPEQINNFITDIYDAFISDYVSGPVKKQNLGPGVYLSLNPTLDIGKVFSVVLFAQGMWAGKQIYVIGGPAGNINVNTYTAMGGLNLWVRVINQNVFKLRIGAGIYGAYTYLYATGDIPHRRLSGSGIGGKALLGSEYRLNEKIGLTLDCGMTFGKSNQYADDPLKVSGIPVKYPTELDHLGFELTPGVVFYF